jgi:hypothetical protein
MTSLQFLQAVLDWLLADPSHIVTTSAALAALIPTPDPATPAGKLYRIIDILALNILHAKEIGPVGPAASAATVPAEPTQPLPAQPHQARAIGLAIALLAGLCALPACSMPEDQAQTVYSLEASYNALAKIALAYEQSATADPAIVAKIKLGDQAAYDSLVAARKAAEANQSATLPAALAAAEDSITDLSNLLAQNGVTS